MNERQGQVKRIFERDVQPQLCAGKPREWYEKMMKEEPKFEMKEAPEAIKNRIPKKFVEEIKAFLKETIPPNQRDDKLVMEKSRELFHFLRQNTSTLAMEDYKEILEAGLENHWPAESICNFSEIMNMVLKLPENLRGGAFFRLCWKGDSEQNLGAWNKFRELSKEVREKQHDFISNKYHLIKEPELLVGIALEMPIDKRAEIVGEAIRNYAYANPDNDRILFELIIQQYKNSGKKVEMEPKEKLGRIDNVAGEIHFVAFLEKWLKTLPPNDVAELLMDWKYRNKEQFDKMLRHVRELPVGVRIAVTEKLASSEEWQARFGKEAIKLGSRKKGVLKSVIRGIYYESSLSETPMNEFLNDENDRLSTASYLIAGIAASGVFAIYCFEKIGNVTAFVILDLVVGAIGSYVVGGLLTLGIMGLGKAFLGIVRVCKFVGEGVWWTNRYLFNFVKSKDTESD